MLLFFGFVTMIVSAFFLILAVSCGEKENKSKKRNYIGSLLSFILMIVFFVFGLIEVGRTTKIEKSIASKYTIIEDVKTRPDIKRSLKILLNQKVSKEELRLIALQLKKQSTDFRRTFIIYYLPGTNTNYVAWATTHFTPDIDVEIIGLTMEEGEKLKSLPLPENSEIIGAWLNEGGRRSRYTMYQQNGKLYLDELWSDTYETSKTEVIVKEVIDGVSRYECKAEEYEGIYFIINSEGNLEMRDELGLLTISLHFKPK